MINKKIYLLLVIFMISLSSCIDSNFNEPELAVYNPNLTVNTTIDELITNFFLKDELVAIDDSVIILGTVIANDKSGNLYKSIVIQDSTAGISIDINSYGLHNKYHVGDLVYVKCKGLYVGDYGGQPKLGADYEGSIGRISYSFMDDYLFKSDGGKPIVAKELSLGLVNDSYINQLVVINDVQFKYNNVGGTYADADLSEDKDIYLENCDGKSMIVRTSGYADFARDIVPGGNGSIIAVLNKYNNNYQLTIRDVDEVVMEGERTCGAIFEEIFEDNLGVFNPYSVIGDNKVWEYSSQFDAAVMSGYDNGNFANEDWLISQAIDLSEYSDLVLNFRHTFGFFTSYNDMKVFICDDFDESNPSTSGSWVELTGFTYPPNDSFFDWVDSGNIDVSAFGGKSSVFLAFKYTSSASSGCTWELDKISISIL